MGIIGEMPPGTPVLLVDADRPAVLAHLLALSPDDRYGRFASALADAGIAAYAERIDFQHDLCFATAEAKGECTGFIHLAVHGAVAELGASVLSGWRQQGQARRLFATALAWATASGIGEIYLATGHPVARRICAALGYAMQEGSGYPRVRVLLPAAAPALPTPHHVGSGLIALANVGRSLV